MPNREAQLVEPSKHFRQGSRNTLVHHELPLVRAAVETPTGHGDEPELRKGNRAARLPEATFQARAERRGQRLDLRVERLQRNDGEREGENTQHSALSVTLRLPARQGRLCDPDGRGDSGGDETPVTGMEAAGIRPASGKASRIGRRAISVSHRVLTLAQSSTRLVTRVCDAAGSTHSVPAWRS